jgi:hypothetical protein
MGDFIFAFTAERAAGRGAAQTAPQDASHFFYALTATRASRHLIVPRGDLP